MSARFALILLLSASLSAFAEGEAPKEEKVRLDVPADFKGTDHAETFTEGPNQGEGTQSYWETKFMQAIVENDWPIWVLFEGVPYGKHAVFGYDSNTSEIFCKLAGSKVHGLEDPRDTLATMPVMGHLLSGGSLGILGENVEFLDIAIPHAGNDELEEYVTGQRHGVILDLGRNDLAREAALKVVERHRKVRRALMPYLQASNIKVEGDGDLAILSEAEIVVNAMNKFYPRIRKSQERNRREWQAFFKDLGETVLPEIKNKDRIQYHAVKNYFTNHLNVENFQSFWNSVQLNSRSESWQKCLPETATKAKASGIERLLVLGGDNHFDASLKNNVAVQDHFAEDTRTVTRWEADGKSYEKLFGKYEALYSPQGPPDPTLPTVIRLVPQNFVEINHE